MAEMRAAQDESEKQPACKQNAKIPEADTDKSSWRTAAGCSRPSSHTHTRKTKKETTNTNLDLGHVVHGLIKVNGAFGIVGGRGVINLREKRTAVFRERERERER